MADQEWTHPDVLTIGVEEGWAEPVTDPATIDWPARQAAALIPFPVIDGRPCIPGPGTGTPRGRGQMGAWGENTAADAVITADTGDGHRWLLLIERGDGHGWATPGGHIDPGEDPLDAASRELTEETGLVVPAGSFTGSDPRLVPDPRSTDEAWMVTVVGRAHLSGLSELPVVVGADDARRAVWARADSYADLTVDLQHRFGGRVFVAHVGFLTELLDRK